MKKRDKDPVIEKEKQRETDTTKRIREIRAKLDATLKEPGSKRVPAKPGEVIVFIPENPKVRRHTIGKTSVKRKHPSAEDE